MRYPSVLSGRTLLSSLVFAQGPSSMQLPDFWGLNPDELVLEHRDSPGKSRTKMSRVVRREVKEEEEEEEEEEDSKCILLLPRVQILSERPWRVVFPVRCARYSVGAIWREGPGGGRRGGRSGWQEEAGWWG
eukprot:762564-Hanusia_phi.AAC.5